jgi:hypothetical protein
VAGSPRNQADLGRAAVRVRPAQQQQQQQQPGTPAAATNGPWGSPQKPQWQQLGAVHAALRIALTAPSALEAAAATHVVAAFCQGNGEGQVSIAATFSPAPATSAEQASFGQELWGALTGSSGGSSSRLPPLAGSQRAALALQHIVAGNAAAKERLAAALGGGDAALGT